MDEQMIIDKAKEYGVSPEFLLAYMDLVDYQLRNEDVSYRSDETDYDGKRVRLVPYLEHATMVNILHSTIKPLRWSFNMAVTTTPSNVFIPVQQYTEEIVKNVWNNETKQKVETVTHVN